MEDENISCVSFRWSKGTVICTLEQDMLRIRVENKHHLMQQVHIISITDKLFPDLLRHTPFHTPAKLFHHLQQHGQKALNAQEGIVAIKIDKDVFVKLPTRKYKIQDYIVMEQQVLSVIDWDLNTTHAKQYLIEGNRLTKLQNGWTQITSRDVLSKEKTTRIKFRCLAYGGKFSIGCGIITKSRKQEQYSGDVQQIESAGYWSRNEYKSGCVCSDGIKTHDWNKQMFTGQGQAIEMVLNPHQWRLRWQNNSKAITTELADCFKEEQLYFYVVMFDKGSKIEMIN